MADSRDNRTEDLNVIVRVAKRTLEGYAQNTVLRSLIELLPMLGGAVNQLFGGWGQELMDKRVMSLLEDLKRAVENLGKEKLDEHFLRSEAFADLLIQGCRQAGWTRNRELIRLYATILASEAVGERHEEFDPQAVMYALSTLSPAEVGLARIIVAKSEATRGPVQVPDDIGDGLGDLEFHVKRLEGAGFIKQHGGTTDHNAPGVFYVTSTLRRLVDLAKASGLDWVADEAARRGPSPRTAD